MPDRHWGARTGAKGGAWGPASRAFRVSGVFAAKILAGTKAGGSPRAHGAVLQHRGSGAAGDADRLAIVERSSSQRATVRRCCWWSGARV